LELIQRQEVAVRFHNGFVLGQVHLAKSVKRCFALAAGLLVLAALPTFASPISFPECPAVGDDTSGCELLITVTATQGMPGIGIVATAFTVTTSNPDQGSYNGGDGTLIGVLNDTSGPVSNIYFTVAPGTGSFAFNGEGACKGTGMPLADIYSPAPPAADCLNGQYWTTDAMDYASAEVTFLSFNLADAGILLPNLASGASAWFSLPGDITASEITVAPPPALTPEPSLLWLLGVGFIGVGLFRSRSAV
jgi:hypothetical protein